MIIEPNVLKNDIVRENLSKSVKLDHLGNRYLTMLRPAGTILLSYPDKGIVIEVDGYGGENEISTKTKNLIGNMKESAQRVLSKLMLPQSMSPTYS